MPEALAASVKAEELAAQPAFKEFLGKLHGAGLTQKQADAVVGEFLDRSMKLQGAMAQISADEATAKLKEAWPADADFKANLSAAYKAGQAYAGGDFEGILKDYGNDARIVKMLAAVGKELAEDTGAPHAGQQMADVDVEALTKSSAYWNPNDPQHASIKAKVTAHYLALHGDKAKSTGSMAFGSTV